MSDSKQQYLIKAGTERVLPFTEALASRIDMILCDVDGNRLDHDGPAAVSAKDTRISELEGLLEKAGAGLLATELEASEQSLEAAEDRIGALTEENKGLTTMVADLEVEVALLKDAHQPTEPVQGIGEPGTQAPGKSEQLETFLNEIVGQDDKDRKKALDDWSLEHLGTNLDGRFSWDKMVEKARAAIK